MRHLALHTRLARLEGHQPSEQRAHVILYDAHATDADSAVAAYLNAHPEARDAVLFVLPEMEPEGR